MTYLGLTIGPSLGGWLATAVRLAFGLLYQCARRIVRAAQRPGLSRTTGEAAREPFDIAGALSFIAGLVACYWRSIGARLGLAFTAALGLLLRLRLPRGVRSCRRARASPMLDLPLFRRRTFRRRWAARC